VTPATAITVDDYVESSVLPEHREIVAMLRALVRECAPGSRERFSYGMPNFTTGGTIFAWILATKKDITFSFRAGTSLKDQHNLLRGKGKHARHVKLKSVDSIARDVLVDYIKQAVALDAK
jgi:hypothetical protein